MKFALQRIGEEIPFTELSDAPEWMDEFMKIANMVDIQAEIIEPGRQILYEDPVIRRPVSGSPPIPPLPRSDWGDLSTSHPPFPIPKKIEEELADEMPDGYEWGDQDLKSGGPPKNFPSTLMLSSRGERITQLAGFCP